MTDTETCVKDVIGQKPDKRYTFDNSFWSFDGYKTREDGYTYPDPESEQSYKDQTYIFNKIGMDVIAGAWEGYHTCLFAYGQTGAGKSHSMTGYGANKGIVPLATTEIFERVAANKDKDKKY